jgi:protease-4
MADAPIFPDAPGGKNAPRSVTVPPNSTIIIQPATAGGQWRVWALRLVLFALAVSLVFNLGLAGAMVNFMGIAEGPEEKFHSGELTATDKIAVIEMSGTIMPPFTERILKQIEKAGKDKNVRGVLLVIDSPGGLVADSHEIYYRLKKLSEEKKKTVWVQMKRIAASGGYYIAMGGGPEAKIYAEETTWTGSIGVIMPRYDVTELAAKVGVKSDSLTTGEFKETMSPFKPLTDRDREIWGNIINQSYEKFMSIIDENRNTLNADQVKALATGQVFTAKDAKANGMIDEIGYEEDTLDALKSHLQLSQVRVIKYESPQTLMDVLLNGQAKSSPWEAILESSVPRAYFYCSWLPPLPE